MYLCFTSTCTSTCCPYVQALCLYIWTAHILLHVLHTRFGVLGKVHIYSLKMIAPVLQYIMILFDTHTRGAVRDVRLPLHTMTQY
jgi:Na+/serine symporter